MNKKRHNGKRSRHAPPAPPPAVTDPHAQTPSTTPDQPQFDPAMVDHLVVATSLIEGRKVTRQEVIEMLQRTMRQHSMATDPPPGYSEGGMKQPPP